MEHWRVNRDQSEGAMTLYGTTAAEYSLPLMGVASRVPAESLAAGSFAVLALAVLARIVWKRKGAHQSEADELARKVQVDWEPTSPGLDDHHAIFLTTETRFCPVCLSEFVRGTEVCEDCGVELVDENDVPEDDPPIRQSVVRVGRVQDGVVVHLIRSAFEECRIPCVMVPPATWGAIGTDVYVFEADALRARRIMGQMLSDLAAPALL